MRIRKFSVISLLIFGCLITRLIDAQTTGKKPASAPTTVPATATASAPATQTDVYVNADDTITLTLTSPPPTFVLKVLRTVNAADGDLAKGGISGLAPGQDVLIIKGRFLRTSDTLTITATQGIFEYGTAGTVRVFKISADGKTVTSDKGLVLTHK